MHFLPPSKHSKELKGTDYNLEKIMQAHKQDLMRTFCCRNGTWRGWTDAKEREGLAPIKIQ